MSSFRAKGAQTLGVLTKEVPAWEVETLVISRWGGAVERNGNGAVDMLDFLKKSRRIPTFYTLLYCRASSTSEEMFGQQLTQKKIRREKSDNE